METLPITARSFEKDYFVDGDNYEKAYKNHLSGFREWSELEHSDEWLVFPENIGQHVSIDETCLSAGEVYTIVCNKEAHGRKGSIIAMEAQYRDRRVKQARLNTTTPILRNSSSEELNLEAHSLVISLLKTQKPQSQRDMSLFLTI